MRDRRLATRFAAGLAAALAAVAMVAALAGCTAKAPTIAAPTPPQASAPSALNSLVPAYPRSFTDASARAETIRVADAIQALIAASSIVHVDDNSRLVAATASTGRYFGVLRTITVDPSLDPIAQATAMAKLLASAGWLDRQSTSDKGRYLDALSSSPDGARAWFVIIGADSTDAKAPVVTIQLASPDFPK